MNLNTILIEYCFYSVNVATVLKYVFKDSKNLLFSPRIIFFLFCFVLMLKTKCS